MSSASISRELQEQQISELVGCVGRVGYGKVQQGEFSTLLRTWCKDVLIRRSRAGPQYGHYS